MPFRRRRFGSNNKRSFGGRRSFRRSFRRRKGFSRLLPHVRSILERKELVSYISGSTGGYDTPYMLLLNGIDQGTNNYNRVGLNVMVRAIYIRVQLLLVAGNACTYCMRTIVDKQPNGAAFVLASNTVNGRYLSQTAGTAFPTGQIEPAGRERFVTLSETAGILQPEFSAAVERLWYERYIKIPGGLKIAYSGAGATITSIVSNSIYFVMYNDLTVASTNSPNIYGTVKLIFTDD